MCIVLLCFRQKTADEVRISDWSADVCFSDLEIVQLEPALAPVRRSIVGGDCTADDEGGDIYLFTKALAEMAERAGVEFRFSTQVSRLVSTGGRIEGVEVIRPDGLYDVVRADAFVAAPAGSAL